MAVSEEYPNPDRRINHIICADHFRLGGPCIIGECYEVDSCYEQILGVWAPGPAGNQCPVLSSNCTGH